MFLLSSSPYYSNSIIRLPYTRNGIQITPFGRTIRLVAKLMEIELAVFWNNDDYLMVGKVLLSSSEHIFGMIKIAQVLHYCCMVVMKKPAPTCLLTTSPECVPGYQLHPP